MYTTQNKFKTIILISFSLLIFGFSLSLAQEVKEKKVDETSKIENPNSPQAVEGDVIFTDGTNQLLRITDEGTTGAIQFLSGVPSNTDFKLYRNGADLYFGNSNLSGSGAAFGINNLDDAIYDGSSSIFIGEDAGIYNTGTNNYNTAVGRSALGNNPPGTNNTAIGFYSLKSNSGLSNTAIGAYSLWNKITGNDNVAIGRGTMYNSAEGSDNIAIGSGSLNNNISGQTNTSIGTQSGYNSLGDGNVFLGYQAGYSETTDNKLYIENSNSTSPLIWGDFTDGIEQVKINGKFSVGDNSSAYGARSFAGGNSTQSHGEASIAFGKNNLSWGDHSTSFGLGSKAHSYLTTAIGRYNVGNGILNQTNWVGTDPLFEIGNGTDDANRSNAFTVLKNASVGINTASPTASLHLIGDNGVLFEGGSGTIPKEGNGSRMMWYQGKSAFRAGSVQTQWDDANVGSYSAALNYRTTASGTYSIATGYQTEASGARSTAMGSDTKASGLHSTAIGSYAEATGDFSTGIGRYVRASGNGTIFIGDNSATSIQNASNDNRFAARFSNGYKFFTSSDLSTYSELLGGQNAWSTTSDSTKKENFLKVDGEEVLNKISKFNLRSWNYIGQDPSKFRHYGPMAQEFFNAFGNDGIGTIGNDTTITTSDFDGINLIAIYALEKRSKEQVSSIQNLESRIEELEQQNQELVKLNSEYKTDIEQIKNTLNQVISNKNEIRMTAK